MGREIVVTSPDGGSPRRFAKDCVELGRLPDLDVCLEAHGNLISRHHAAVFFEDGDLYIKDMGSRTGTFLNGDRVGQEPVNVMPEDLIQLGKSGPSFHFELGESPAADVVKRGERKRLMGNSTLSVALDAVVSRERARAKKVVGLTAGAGIAAVLLVVLAAFVIHQKGVTTLETAHATELEKVKSEERLLEIRIGVLGNDLARKDEELVSAHGVEERATKLEKEAAALRAELERLTAALEAKKRSEALATLAGTYDIATTEAGSAGNGYVVIDRDGTVIRQVVGADGTLRTRWGTAQLKGAALAVNFEGNGDPRDLSGDWTVRGEGASGAYTATATLERTEDVWSTTFHITTTGDGGEGDETVQLWGRLANNVLTVERGPPGGSTTSVHYMMSATGLRLRGTFQGKTETFSRRRLPAGGGTTATYSCDGSRLSGSLATGDKDSGARSHRTPSDGTGSGKPGVRADPVPLRLQALRESRIRESAREDGKILATAKPGWNLKVIGSENQCWKASFTDPTSGSGWIGYVLKDDLQPTAVRYKALTGALLTGAPSAAGAQQRDLGVCYFVAALMAIARTQPDAIRDMIRDERDGTVSVRFYQRDEQGRLEPVWYRMNKSVIVDDEGKVHYADGGEGQMWCPIIVKAFASVHGGGFYGGIENGFQSDVYELVLGREGARLAIPGHLPSEFAPGNLKRIGVSDADVKVVTAYVASAAGAAERLSLVESPSWRGSLERADESLARMAAIGLSADGRSRIHEYFRTHCVGSLGSGKYSSGALDLLRAIRESLDKRTPIGLGTRHWGHGGTGNSAGENVEVVAGLASSHAYVVLDTSDHDGLSWVKVANPWHIFSRRYERVGEKWKATGTSQDPAKRSPGDNGEFEVELSDVVRYFDHVELMK